MQALADPAERAARAAAGLAQAARFRTDDQAAAAMTAFRGTVEALAAGKRAAPGRGWREFRTYQGHIQALVQDRPEVAASLRDAAGNDREAAAPARPSGELQRALAQIEAMQRSPFWRLRDRVLTILRATGLRR